jgi:hypothetical protein
MVAKNGLYTFLIVLSPKDHKQMTHEASVEEYVGVVTELFTAQYNETLDVCLEYMTNSVFKNIYTHSACPL